MAVTVYLNIEWSVDVPVCDLCELVRSNVIPLYNVIDDTRIKHKKTVFEHSKIQSTGECPPDITIFRVVVCLI